MFQTLCVKESIWLFCVMFTHLTLDPDTQKHQKNDPLFVCRGESIICGSQREHRDVHLPAERQEAQRSASVQETRGSSAVLLSGSSGRGP